MGRRELRRERSVHGGNYTQIYAVEQMNRTNLSLVVDQLRKIQVVKGHIKSIGLGLTYDSVVYSTGGYYQNSVTQKTYYGAGGNGGNNSGTTANKAGIKGKPGTIVITFTLE